MTRHLPRLLLLTGALLSPVTLYALGLGEIRLNSALNQPFDADIELISPTADELAGLKIALANNDMFARYGIDRPQFLSTFQFAIGRGRDGRPSIKVTSTRSVTEPFVTMLVEASWSRGRLLREYTVLLDPPVFTPSQPQAPAPVTPAETGTQGGRIERQPSAPTTAPVPVPEPESTREPTRPVTTPDRPSEEPLTDTRAEAALGGDYTVERNDTLWRIASRVTPGSPRTVNKTMIALYRANPDAFTGNINRLRAGSVLRVPEMPDIDAISTSDAAAEVARQTAEWSGAQPVATTAEPDRLKLVSPPEETSTAPTPAPTTPTASTSPAPTQTPPPETTAAVTPTPSTQPPIEPAPDDKRVEITSPGLAGVQQGTTTPEQQPTPPVETPTTTAEQPPVETPVDAQPKQPAPQPRATPAGPSLVDRIADLWWVLVVAGLVVVVGFALLFVKRKREASSMDELDSAEPMSFEPRVVERSQAQTRARSSDAFVLDEPEPSAFDEGDEAPTAIPPPPPPPTARRSEGPKTRPLEPVADMTAARPTEDTLSSETAIRLDQQDALAEADFHMAYGLYDQAADLVKIAIDREPSRRDLKHKLLEIYFVWGNRDLFIDTARDLYGTRNQAAAGEWDKVVIMGKQIAPDDPMFKGEGGHVDLVDVNLEGGENRVDVDLFAEPDADKPAGLDLEFASGERRGPSSAGDLDFLLDEPKRGADDDPTRELDPLSRTQETPTIESPILDRGGRGKSEQTAELSLDDLGLDVDSLEATGSLEDTSALEKDPGATVIAPLRDNEMTQLAPALGHNDRTMQAPRPREETFDVESTGTIYVDQVDLSGGDTVEQPRPSDVDSTASLKRLESTIDIDLDNPDGKDATATHDTIRQPRRGDAEADSFSTEVFGERTSEVPRIDLDVGDALHAEDHAPTNKQVITAEMELSELEPVTMSEVGTKLDLARAYMDMGDPDGARSILEEVMSEGNPHQKQEAQRLIESIR